MAPTSPIRRDDLVPGSLVSLHLALMVAAIVVGKAARDALALSHYAPQQITLMDLGTIAATALVVAVQMKMRGRLPTTRVLMLSPLIFALGDVALWLTPSRSAGAAMALVTYVWMGIQAAFGAPQASVLASYLLTPRQAKRFCGWLGASAILGWIGGGLLTQRLAERYGTSSLLLTSAVLTAFCSFEAAWLVSHRVGAYTPRTPTRATQVPHGLVRSGALVWASPHLRAMASLALISSAVTTIVGLQFKFAAIRSNLSSDHLAAFLGSFNVSAGVVALVTQLLITSRIVGAFGPGLALLIAPVALAAGSLGILCSSTLAAATFLKGTDQVLRYSVDRAAIELLYRPLSQDEILESKTFIDAIVSKIGDALGGVVVLLGAIVLRLSMAWLGVISLALLLGWMALARVARRRYLEVLQDNLGHPVPMLDGAPPRGLRKCRRQGEGFLLARLLDPNPGVRLATLRTLTPSDPSCRSRAKHDPTLSTALGAEAVGLAVLVETAPAAAPALADGDTVRDAIERVARLLQLISAERYPERLRRALCSGEPTVTAKALDYLDATLPSPYRQFLIPVLERWTGAL